MSDSGFSSDGSSTARSVWLVRHDNDVVKQPVPVPIDRLRLDVLVVPTDDGRKIAIPDPRRYEVVGPDESDTEGLLDRTSRLFYPWPVVEEMIAKTQTVPVRGPSPRVDLAELVRERARPSQN